MPSTWPDLDRRELVGEVMDDPSLDADAHRLALLGLRRINTVSLTAPTLFRALRSRLGTDPRRERKILDVACGDGDTTLRVARLAKRAGLPWRFMGCDLSPQAVDFARRLSAGRRIEADFFIADAIKGLDCAPYDAVINALFLHHLEDEQITAFLHRLRATKHVVISDLVRSRFAYGVTQLGVRLLSRSRVVHVDGPLSVRAALTPGELAVLARQAGLGGVLIKRSYPMRQMLLWSRP